MAEAPNFRPDAEHRGDVGATDAPTSGWSALDRDRRASLADEGGRAGAVMEGQDENRPVAGAAGPRSAAARRLGLILAAAGLLIGAFLIRRGHP